MYSADESCQLVLDLFVAGCTEPPCSPLLVLGKVALPDDLVGNLGELLDPSTDRA